MQFNLGGRSYPHLIRLPEIQDNIKPRHKCWEGRGIIRQDVTPSLPSMPPLHGADITLALRHLPHRSVEVLT